MKYLFIFCTILFGNINQNDAINVEKDCPCDFLSLNNHCYYFSQIKLDWYEARIHCEQLFASLAYPINDAENSELTKHLNETYKNTVEWWIGGNDIQSETNWVWEKSGLKIVDRNNEWRPNEPNNACVKRRPTAKPSNDGECSSYCLQENCMVYEEKENWKWNDVCCDIQTFFICQK